MAEAQLPEVLIVRSWDSDQIVALYRAGGWWKEGYDPTGIPSLIAGSLFFAVAVDPATGIAVGMGRVISDGVSDGYIQDLVVLPEYRRSGIGRRVVSLLIKSCREKGIHWIGLVSQPGCEEFYSDLGFVKMEGYIPLLYEMDT